ncbi:hypothetical protein [Gordonia sihwensis]|uniref:hypothetical protein n=1 Tax=Gordonia sihwensis TaxID=173559 RepID=UPI003D9954CC
MKNMNWEQISDQLTAKGLTAATAQYASKRNAPGFAFEADWTYYGTGHGVTDRWLITSVGTDSIGTGVDRWLLAYDIDADNATTGRVVLLGGPISDEDDSRLLEKAQNSGWWNGGRVDLETLDRWLRSEGVK